MAVLGRSVSGELRPQLPVAGSNPAFAGRLVTECPVPAQVAWA